MQGISKTAEIVYNQMLETTSKEVSKTALFVIDKLQTKKPAVQLLGLGALMVILLNQYGLSAADVLGIAHNMVFSGENGNTHINFKTIKDYMKEEWEL